MTRNMREKSLQVGRSIELGVVFLMRKIFKYVAKFIKNVEGKSLHQTPRLPPPPPLNPCHICSRGASSITSPVSIQPILDSVNTEISVHSCLDKYIR